MKTEPHFELPSKDALNSMREFMDNIEGMQTVYCDDPMKASTGYVSFCQDKDGKENSVYYYYHFAKPVEDVDCVLLSRGDLEKSKSIPVETLMRLQGCITEEGWVMADDPKNLLMGWVKYAPLGSADKSIAYTIHLETVKALKTCCGEGGQELYNELSLWREKHQAKFAE